MISQTYPHLMSPLTIRGKVLKNRMLNSKCAAYQANELELAGDFYENLARNGAATVTMSVGTFPDCEGKRSPMSRVFMDDPAVQDKYREMIERVHKHGSLCSASLMGIEPQDVAISDVPNWEEIPMTGDYSVNLAPKPGISAERLQGMIDDFVYACKQFKMIGFDMVTFYVSYRGSILSCSLSPLLNQRTDQYGGPSMKDRATLTLEIFRRVREACGEDFIIEVQISGSEEAPGYTEEDFLDYCALCEGLVDIFQIRGWDGSYTHVNGHNTTPENPYNLRFAEAFKKRGIKAIVSPVGGFQYPEFLDAFIRDGKTDCVSIARAFIADEDYGEKICTGRGEDIIPCLLCNGCHEGFCAVNPYAGYSHMKDRMFQSSGILKKVAVVGGGPAGIRAALFAAEKGHTVTLYEKESYLGGQLRFSDYADFKWPVKRYKDWLIRQLQKSDVDIHLSTEAIPENLRGKFDVIICALGSTPKRVPVPGADGPWVWFAEDVFGRELELGERIVVVGGGETGRQTALYLAKAGHQTTLVTRGQAHLFEDMHAKRASELDYENEPNFNCLEYAQTVEIGENYVCCDVKRGVPHKEYMFGDPADFEKQSKIPNVMPSPGVKIGFEPPEDDENMPDFLKPKALPPSKVIQERVTLECDSIVISGGRVPNTQYSERFADCAPEVCVIGDNFYVADIKNCTNTAFAAVMQL